MASGKKPCCYRLGDSWQGRDCDQLSHPLALFPQDSCVRYLPPLYLDIHVREYAWWGRTWWGEVGCGEEGLGGGRVGWGEVGWGRAGWGGVGQGRVGWSRAGWGGVGGAGWDDVGRGGWGRAGWVGWGRMGWGGVKQGGVGGYEPALLLAEGAARVRRGLRLCWRTPKLSLWSPGSYFSQSPLLSPLSELLCAGQAAGFCGLSSVLENG